MITLKEKTQSIRTELKRNNITSKQVSVRGKDVAYDESIDIRIKDMNVDIDFVKSIANKFIRVDRDEFGDILAGCNTYVHAQYDYKAINEASVEFLEKAKNIFNIGEQNKNELNIKVYENEENSILYTPCWNNTQPPHIDILNDKKVINSYIVIEPEGISQALMYFKYFDKVNILA